MIISHKYKFVFIKTMKTAGTSIEIYLSAHCGMDDVVTPLAPHVERHKPRNHAGFYNHMPAAEVAARLPAVWSEYLTFCVERNPWDKTLSHFYMLKNSPFHNPGRDISLDEYLSGEQLPLNYPLYTDHTRNRVIVDHILRYEDLAAGLEHVFSLLGVPFGGDLGVHAKSEWRTDRRHYREVFTQQQASRIGELFETEIRINGYQY
ncbi:MAG: hypothetical protein HY288_13085 [Planctomycetia bacterium]|nr:hypothetical protein [Planctomycetia bacterium]